MGKRQGRRARRRAWKRRRGAERPSYHRTVLAIRLFFSAFCTFVIGTLVTAMFIASGSVGLAVGACVLGVGAVPLGVRLWFYNRQWKDEHADNDYTTESDIIDEFEPTATTPLTTTASDDPTVVTMLQHEHLIVMIQPPQCQQMKSRL
uniref:Uncharacterized protein n=1 Tax=Branchiostoma floridae TaxID=7739 RepID=C3YWL2_BRAFL|eukprot:XP_002599244.1 hypothetical protein BRAFLDRAFT_64406 [Branchiostoma floridae]